jgi:hypothetical protein
MQVRIKYRSLQRAIAFLAFFIAGVFAIMGIWQGSAVVGFIAVALSWYVSVSSQKKDLSTAVTRKGS